MSRSHKRSVSRSSRSQSRGGQAESFKSNRIYTAQRVMTAEHRRVLKSALTQVLGDNEPIRIPHTKLHVGTLTVGQSRRVFWNHFAPDSDRAEATRNFNETTARSLEGARSKRPTISAELGELGIFGMNDPSVMGNRFVGIHLEGQGAAELMDENIDLRTALGNAALCSSPLRGTHSDPHITLAKTYDYPTAVELMGRLNEGGAVEIAREQLAAITTEPYKGEVKFGPVLSSLIPISEYFR